MPLTTKAIYLNEAAHLFEPLPSGLLLAASILDVQGIIQQIKDSDTLISADAGNLIKHGSDNGLLVDPIDIAAGFVRQTYIPLGTAGAINNKRSLVQSLGFTATATAGNILTYSTDVTAVSAANLEVPTLVPGATSTTAGLMTAADVIALADVINNVNILMGGAVTYVTTVALSASTSQSDVQAAYTGAGGPATVVNGTLLVSSNASTEGFTFVWSAALSKWMPQTSASVSTATNTSLGIVKGTEPDSNNPPNTYGTVYVESDGSQSVNGWDDLMDEITIIKGNISSLQMQIGVPDNITLEIAPPGDSPANVWQVKEGGIGTGQLADGAVTEAKLAAGLLDRTIIKINLDEDKAAGMALTVPAYVVGSNKLRVEFSGLPWRKNLHYLEVGSNGESSTSITIVEPLVQTADLYAIVG